MTQPFDEEDLLYRFKLTLEEIKRLGLLADECVVTENSLYLCTDQYWWEPAIEYQRQRVRDFIITRLLNERDALTTNPQCSGQPIAGKSGVSADGILYPGDSQHCQLCAYKDELRERSELLTLYDKDNRRLFIKSERLTAKLNICTYALTQLADPSSLWNDGIGSDLAAKALEQLAKIQED